LIHESSDLCGHCSGRKGRRIPSGLLMYGAVTKVCEETIGLYAKDPILSDRIIVNEGEVAGVLCTLGRFHQSANVYETESALGCHWA
jgi:hypothetical protein